MKKIYKEQSKEDKLKVYYSKMRKDQFKKKKNKLQKNWRKGIRRHNY